MAKLLPLTAKRKRFVAEYLIDHNGAQAAIRAGYSRNCAAQAASGLLRNKAVAQALADAEAELADRMELTKERVIAELGRVGFSDIREVVQWRSAATETEGEDGEPGAHAANVVEVKDAADLSPEVAAAIAEVSQLPNGGLRVKLHDKLAALAELGKYVGRERRKQAGGLTVEIVRFGGGRASE